LNAVSADDRSTPMAADNKPNPELSKVDQAIAADADALLQGDFETIDAVLEGVFEEQAALVQMDAKSPAANPRALASSRAATPPVPSTPTTVPPPTEPIAAVTPVETKPPEPVAVAAVVAEPAFSPSAEAAQHHAAVSSMPVESEARVEVTAPVQPTTPRPAIVAVLKRAAVSMLLAVNYPLRFIPAPHKPIVDWIALSLVGWVPVVWILALTLGNKNAHVQASAEVHKAGSVLATTPTEDKALHATDEVDEPAETHATELDH
jgi:hypothetical protein